MVYPSPRVATAGGAPGGAGGVTRMLWHRAGLELVALLLLTPLLAAAVASVSEDPAGAYGQWWAAAVGLRYFGIAVLILVEEQSRQRRSWPVETVFQLPWSTRLLRLRCASAGRALAISWLLVMVFVINDHIMPGMFLVHTYTTQVLIEATALLNPAGAAALALPLVALGAAVALLALRVGRVLLAGDTDLPAALPRVGRLRSAASCAAALLVVAVALLIPLAAVASRCASLAAIGESFLTTRAELWHTLWLAVVGGLLCALLAAMLVDRWLACRRRSSVTLVPVILLNLLAPASLLGLGVIALGGYWPLSFVRDSSWPLIVGYVVRFVPVAMLVCYAAWRRESRLPEHAAAVHGLSRWRTLWCVTWPRRRAVILWCAALCALLIGTELDLSVLLVRPGTSTLGVRLYTLMHTAPDSMVSAAALNVVLLVVVAIGLWVALASLRVQMKGGRRS